jgi:hypothetical protein
MNVLSPTARRALVASALAVILGGGLAAAFVLVDDPVGTGPVLRRVDLVASVDAVNVDADFSMEGPTTRGAMRLDLDDLRTLVVVEGTLVDDQSLVPACTTFDTANSCVLLADMLGDAVVWFALVPADTVRGRERLTLPGLVDMRDNGGLGVLANGWVLRLATPVVRECGDIDTANLRDFITRFPASASAATVDLVTDTVTRVDCAD